MKPLLFPDLYERLDDELRYVFDERAGIVEFDAHQPRETAEYLALVELLREFPAAFLGFATLRLDFGGGQLWALARRTSADALCTRHGARHVDVADVLGSHFGGVAVLAACPVQLRETQQLI